MAKLTKSQIFAALAEKAGVSKKDAQSFWEAMYTLAISEVRSNGEFTFPGVGKLVKAHRNARVGRNPATGEQIQIPAKTVVKFRVAKAAKDSIL
ncbi:MAG: HU family DNA-binding protein [bacterium]|nr:HU family DNA-binding protein [bacterium]